ncbi:GNAT family N-acetyltransferase [Chitinivibrio alkaliphilus]|uniref:GCN5-related N-acetyltransferase n=1 Tax=Chitinivibrio alkaliphilus ACht1 TaxID=1313304 RepID=U7D8L8_9BACT|nr:GNAT family N-acetyltransferase [Chitinivibrio alkaliphilus]ERP31906.1 GCN5-related N-acetyltransferase [Chitinivibrio alkaliphilus ACht1]
MKNAVITTERTALFHLCENDVDLFLPLFTNPEAMRWFPSVMDRKQVQEWVDMVRGCYDRDGFGFYKIIRHDDQQLLGYCGPILQKDVDGVDEIEFGYALIPEFWGNGYARETARAALEYVFRSLGASRCISLIRPENTPSIRVAEHNGLSFEKAVDRWGFIHHVYTLSREDFQ